ncbi:MAG: hypothetical protein IJD07_04950 [Clostridia bacterium]|nr:hypothetical protein [Clostridia bacterium]
MKNKRIILIIMICMFMLAIVSSPVVAYMIKRVGTTTNTFVPAAVECQLNEEFTNNEKTSITVTNRGNIDAYIRVRLVTYMTDEDGNVTTATPPSVNFTLDDSWIKDEDSNTYYYKDAVVPNGETGNLLKTKISLEEGQVVVVLAEAIQANPSSAVAGAWGVTIADGKITAA